MVIALERACVTERRRGDGAPFEKIDEIGESAPRPPKLNRLGRLGRDLRSREESVTMNKKVFSLAFLVVFAAFAVMATGAQAAPHWFKNGAIQKEATPVPVMTWGGAINLKQESPAGEINCKAVGAGFVENPTGGGAGTGKSQSSNFYECKEPKCEAEVAASELGKAGFKGVGFAVAYNLPWNNLLEGEVEPFVEKIGAVPNGPKAAKPAWGGEAAEGYPAKQKEPAGNGAAWGAAGAIGAVVGCEVSPNPEAITGKGTRVVGELPFEGELHPTVGGGLNEAGNALKPAKAEFKGKESGELEDPLGPGAGGNNTGQIKYLGYTVQDSIQVK
jgi:hypothetical protein